MSSKYFCLTLYVVIAFLEIKTSHCHDANGGNNHPGNTTTADRELYDAARLNNTGTALQWILRGATNHYRDEKGETALHMAAENGNVQVAQKILDVDPLAVHDTGNDGWSVLSEAAFHGRFEVAELLIIKGANVTAKQANNKTALDWAAYFGYMKIAKLLVEHGADAHYVDAGNNSLLFKAALLGDLEVVKFLVGKGVDVHLLNYQKKSALQVAIEVGHNDVVHYLLSVI